MSKNNKKYIFLHIPKAAGTTFNAVLYDNFKLNEIYKIDGTYPKKSLTNFLSMGCKFKNKVNLLMGHQSFGAHKDLSGEFRYITMLREPVSRVVSLYHYIMTTKQHPLYEEFHKENVTFDLFIRGKYTKEVTNDQVRSICGTRDSVINEKHLEVAFSNLNGKFDFIGITEKFDESMLLMKLNIPKIKNINYISKNIGKEIKLKTITNTEQIRIIKERNSMDIKLYDFYLKKFDGNVKKEGIKNKLERYVAENESYRKRMVKYEFFYKNYRKIKIKLKLIYGKYS